MLVKLFKKIYKTPLIFAPCGLPCDPVDRCAASGSFKGTNYLEKTCDIAYV